MSLINWIFDIYQHSKIDRAQEDAAHARRELAQIRQNVNSGGGAGGEQLERALGELALATKTVQRILTEKGVCSPEEFANMLRQIDAEDGRIDGQSPV